MGCGACGPSVHTGAPTCCGRPMKDKGDQYICAVSSGHTAPKPSGSC